MMKRALAFSFLFLSLHIHATTVNPQVGESSWTIASNLGTVSDETTPTPLSDADAVGGVITINTAGNYYLKENITSRIVIAADNVCLDLNCRAIQYNGSNDDIITVNQNRKNITIHDGTIINTAGLGTGSGILVDDGASRIHFIKLKVIDCGHGFTLDGTEDAPVTTCLFEDCDFIQATTSGFIRYGQKNVLKNCKSLGSFQAGFELYHSKRNRVTNCRAIETLSETTAVGFQSRSGQGNLFEGCIVKDTKTSAWDFCNKSYGFLLTGTESKTKIIDCIVNETDMTSTVSSVAYGIHLDPILLEGSDLLDIVDDDSTPGDTIWSVAWSPCGKYVAAGDADNYLRVFSFDETSLVQTTSDNTSAANILSVSWSPDSNYIAVGDAGDNLRIFRFNGSILTQVTSDSAPTGDVNEVAWSPDGKFIATADDGGKIRVCRFDGTTLTLVDDANVAIAEAIAWSPDGRFIAAPDSSTNLHIFSFTGSALNSVTSDGTAGSNIYSIAWSPNGRQIAAGDVGGFVRVYSFNGTSLIHIDDDNTTGGQVWAIAWSPNGKYIVSGDTGTEVNIFSFNGSTLYHIKSDDTAGSLIGGVAWSPCGQYIASGSDDTVVRVYDAMYGPTNCLIKNNTVCDTSSYGQMMGTGIMTGGCNCVIKNCCYNNEVNYSYGIPHVYYANQNDTIRPQDNISTPPF